MHALGKVWGRLPVSIQALSLQLLVAPVTLLFWVAFSADANNQATLLLILSLVQGFLSAVASAKFSLPKWWWMIQLLFWPLLIMGMHSSRLVALAPIILVLLLLVFGGVFRHRVPLFLSSRMAVDSLSNLLPAIPGARVVDLGCGTGGLLCALKHKQPSLDVSGIEAAPIPWALAWLRCRFSQTRVKLHFGSFWDHDLSEYDVVYAYLSPAPMARLWQKISTEMRDGSLFISNTFEVPDVPPERVVAVHDWNHSELFIWRIRHGKQFR